MAEATALRYMILPLTAKETAEGAMNFGLLFARKNKDRWIDVSEMTYELQTYDKGFTYIVLDDIVYMIHRDFLLSDEKVRLYIGKRFDHDTDVLHKGILSKDGEILHTWKSLVDSGQIVVSGSKIEKFENFNYPNDVLCIPDDIDGFGTTVNLPFENVELGGIEFSKNISELRDHLFHGVKMKSIVIPDTVSKIGIGCFSRSTLETVKLPHTVTSIGSSTFSYCPNLKSVDLGACGISEIESAMFVGSGDNISTIQIPITVKKIHGGAFQELRNVREIIIPEGVEEIYAGAFKDCTNSTIRVPNTVKKIEANAFENVRKIIYRGTLEGAPWGALSMN